LVLVAIIFSQVFCRVIEHISPGSQLKEGGKGRILFLFIRVILTRNPKSFPRTVRAIFERLRGENQFWPAPCALFSNCPQKTAFFGSHSCGRADFA
jgi:hypothetical protein